MTSNTKDSPRLGGSLELDPDDVQRLPFVSLLPKTSPSASNASRRSPASPGADSRPPSASTTSRCTGGARGSSRPAEPLHALYMYAARFPGGLQILMGEGFQLTFFSN